MSADWPHDDSLQSISVLEEIDAACDRFEKAWRAKQQPRIEDYVAEASECARSSLVRELLRVEIACRLEKKETILPDDYMPRFPEHASLITELLVNRHQEEAPFHLKLAGRYQLKEFIAGGGMGNVYRAHDPKLHRPLAVKVLKWKFRDHADLVTRFLREARITSQLQHPGVPPVHEIGRLANGLPFIAMKLIQGRTLADLLAERRSPAEDFTRLLTIFQQVCQTIAYAHSRGVIHRDLKPANVMVGKFGEVQVMDWGLAKVVG